MHDCENGFWHLLTLINRCVKNVFNLFSIRDTQKACTVELERSRWLFTFEAHTLINVYMSIIPLGMIQCDNLQQDKREMLIFMALKTKESLYSDLYQQSIRVIYLCTYKEKNKRFLKGRPQCGSMLIALPLYIPA